MEKNLGERKKQERLMAGKTRGKEENEKNNMGEGGADKIHRLHQDYLFQDEEKRRQEKVAEILADFETRRQKRKPFELGWLLNINFVLGNQYSYVSSKGDVKETDKTFAWESREVFNHIAPIIESRLAKLNRVKPSMSVRPTGNEEKDIETARMSKMVLDSVSQTLGIPKIVSDATLWSEVCGTSFYKIGWDWTKGNEIARIEDEEGSSSAGQLKNKQSEKSSLENVSIEQEKSENLENIEDELKVVKNEFWTSGENEKSEKLYGETAKENSFEKSGQKGHHSITDGDVSISVCSPFEIFPDSASACDIDECESIIHAKTISEDEALLNYGVKVSGQTVDSLSFDLSELGFFGAGESNIKKSVSESKDGQVYVIERYIRPSEENKNGVLEIVVGDKLVYEGEIPSGEIPFVRQISSASVGCFWGISVVERCIPVQRAYNAIKNRKIEFLSRLASGVLAVEEGSVDIDNLEEEGLAPGKILVYRNGSNLPKFMDSGDIPSEFSVEEDRLLNEFISLTGVSELMRNSALPSSVTSGTAINLLIEQDDTRLSVSAEHIRTALLELSKKILRLYKNFARVPKLAKIVDNNGELQIFYWQGSELSADDVVLDTTNELSETPATRRNMVMEILNAGLLADENGRIDTRTKAKVLDMLGFGNWESSQDIASLQVRRAKNENLKEDGVYVLEIDDHEIHIEEHLRYLLEHDGSLSDKKVDYLLGHIREHKMFKKNVTEK